jgi:hypothetical protein
MSKKKYTFTMVVVKPTGKGGKPLKPKEIKPKNKSTGGSIEKVPGGYSKEGSGRISDKGLKGRSPQQVFSEKEKRMESTKAQGMTKKMGGGMMKKYNKGGQMLKGGQKKLDKNKDGKISGEDFKLIRREKPEMKPIKRSMGSTSTEGNIKHGKLKSQKELKKITDSDEYKKSDYQTKNKMLNVATQSKGGEMKKGYGAARQSGMGLQDENLVPGKSMDYYKDLM